MRILIALLLVIPIYQAIDFGWEWLFIIGLQIFAGLDFKLFNNKN